MGRRLVAVKVENRCVVCKAGEEKRAAVDQWLTRRDRGEKDEAGRKSPGLTCSRTSFRSCSAPRCLRLR